MYSLKIDENVPTCFGECIPQTDVADCITIPDSLRGILINVFCGPICTVGIHKHSDNVVVQILDGRWFLMKSVELVEE